MTDPLPYCTVADVRGRALDGALDETPDADLAEAIIGAGDLVDRYCERFFGQQIRTLALPVSIFGEVTLPVDPSDPETLLVTWRDGSTTGLAGSWTWLPGLHGQRSVLQIDGGRGGYDMLIAGAEPWNGGFANLRRGSSQRSVIVTGLWGTPRIPTAVRSATALLAATILGAPTSETGGDLLPGVSSLAGVKALSVEGSSVTFEDGAHGEVARGSESLPSTGSPEADRLLVPYVTRTSGWHLA